MRRTTASPPCGGVGRANMPCWTSTTISALAIAVLLDGHEDRMAHLAFDRLGEMALAGRVLDQQHLAGADDARLAVARLDRHAAVEVDDVLPARRGMPFVVVG